MTGKPKKAKQLYNVHIVLKLPPPYDKFIHVGVSSIRVRKRMLEIKDRGRTYRYDGRDVKEILVRKLRGKGYID